jgi:hypothetical protein
LFYREAIDFYVNFYSALLPNKHLRYLDILSVDCLGFVNIGPHCMQRVII